MSDVVYRADIRIERVQGPLRRAYLPAESEHIYFGMHSDVAAYYGRGPDVKDPHATTLDYVIASTGG